MRRLLHCLLAVLIGIVFAASAPPEHARAAPCHEAMSMPGMEMPMHTSQPANQHDKLHACCTACAGAILEVPFANPRMLALTAIVAFDATRTTLRGRTTRPAIGPPKILL